MVFAQLKIKQMLTARSRADFTLFFAYCKSCFLSFFRSASADGALSSFSSWVLFVAKEKCPVRGIEKEIEGIGHTEFQLLRFIIPESGIHGYSSVPDVVLHENG